MRRIVAAMLPLNMKFVLPRHRDCKILRLHAVENEESPDGLTVKMFMEVDPESPLAFSYVAWFQTNEVLPDSPAMYLGTITPGSSELHLYELVAEKVPDEVIERIVAMMRGDE